jgi:hypothetical protein
VVTAGFSLTGNTFYYLPSKWPFIIRQGLKLLMGTNTLAYLVAGSWLTKILVTFDIVIRSYKTFFTVIYAQIGVYLARQLPPYSVKHTKKFYRSGHILQSFLKRCFQSKKFLDLKLKLQTLFLCHRHCLNISRGRIFSRVRPFYEWAVSDLDP